MHLRTKAVASVTALLMIAGAGAAFADTVAADGDLTTPRVADATLAFGTVACNADAAKDIEVWAIRNGQINNNTFANSAILALGASLAPGSSGVTFGLATGSPTLPRDWATPGVLNNGATSTTATVPLIVHPTATGSYSATVNVSLVGNAYQSGTLTRTTPLTVTWSADCTPPNTAPTTPGTPTASANPTKGGFTLSWTASTDTQNDVFTYTLEGKRANETAYSQIASGLTSASHTFAAGGPLEGTWTYRVKAVETKTGGLSSDYSGESAPVVVDQTRPTLTADAGAPAYTPTGSAPWWKDTASVIFTANDPALADGSAGSGVDAASFTASQTFNTQGAFSTGPQTAKDLAGNGSSAVTLEGNLDTAAPVLNVTCPSGPFYVGSTATGSWNATDDGGSGVKGTDSGTFGLDMRPGAHEALKIDAVEDNVGHTSNSADCPAYQVVYNFGGFLKPVVSGINVAKAGSAIPLKFSLGGDYGLNIIQSTNVKLSLGEQDGTPVDTVVFAIGSGLHYDAATGQYTYVWKTDKSWSGKSGTMTLTLLDGIEHTIQVSFK